MHFLQYGFRILGGCQEERRLVDTAAAFKGYADCDPRAEVEKEAYLSAFSFGDEFRDQLIATRSTKGYAGACWSSWLWFDIDREGNLGSALTDTRKLCAGLIERYGIAEDELLAFFSGSKGFHVGLPTSLWQPEPALSYHGVTRLFAEKIADRLTIEIDVGVYDRVRAFRAPNSRHPKTGLFKRRLLLSELNSWSVSDIVQYATEPLAFHVPSSSAHNEQAVADWLATCEEYQKRAEAMRHRRLESMDNPQLNRLTLQFIRDGANAGDRHRTLFSAAANLAEFGCPPELAHAFLTGAARDSGLAPKDIHRTIESGLGHARMGDVA